MSEWNSMTYEGKDNVLRVVQREADGMFAMAESPEVWETQTAAAKWQVRDIIGHLVDTTEAYFVAFDAARGNGEVADAYGLPGMAERANAQAQAFREVEQEELLNRLSTDQEKMMGMLRGLTEDEWSNLMVPHFYMGPLPSFFYPAFQLMDYGCIPGTSARGSGGPTVSRATLPTCSSRSCSSCGSTRPPPRTPAIPSTRGSRLRPGRTPPTTWFGSGLTGSRTRWATCKACR
jgi:mycothiol maleylpyruvate isomerase-like protein